MRKSRANKPKKDFDLLNGENPATMDYAAWRSLPKYHSKKLKERFKMNNRLKEEILNRCGGRCVICGGVENLQVDHIIPISRGGKTEPNNLQILCKSCNQKKHDKTMEEFLESKHERKQILLT